MNAYDEDDINEQNARELYYTVRDAISQAIKAEIPLPLAGIAAAIADEIEDPMTLTKLAKELDDSIMLKIDAHAESTASDPKKANKGNSVASRGIVDNSTNLLKDMNDVFFGEVNKALWRQEKI